MRKITASILLLLITIIVSSCGDNSAPAATAFVCTDGRQVIGAEQTDYFDWGGRLHSSYLEDGSVFIPSVKGDIAVSADRKTLSVGGVVVTLTSQRPVLDTVLIEYSDGYYAFLAQSTGRVIEVGRFQHARFEAVCQHSVDGLEEPPI